MPDFESEAAWRDWVDAVCKGGVSFVQSSVDQVKKLLDPRNALEMDCRVKKHPDCCILCALNNDCDRLPMHVRCRCTPDVYLKFDE